MGWKSPGRTSAQNVRDPSRGENPKILSHNSTGKLPGLELPAWRPELPGHRIYPGELPGRSSRTPLERNPKNDLAVFALGRNFQPKAGISAHRKFRPKGRNFRSSKGRKPTPKRSSSPSSIFSSIFSPSGPNQLRNLSRYFNKQD